MKAVNVASDGKLFLSNQDKPIPKSNELLIKVHAFGINRADLLQAKGKYPPPKGATEILGLEFSGEVILGESDSIKKGDSVFGLVPDGAYAEFVAVDKHMVRKIPNGLDQIKSAGIAEVFLTAWQTLFSIGDVQKGEIILVHAGASGVGHAAIQLAKWNNCKVITTVSSHKCEFVESFGADLIIPYDQKDFEEVINLENSSPNLILDSIGGDYLLKNIRCLNTDGRIIQIASMNGNTTEIKMHELFKKRASLHFSTLRSRSLDYQQALFSDFWKNCENAFITKKLDVFVDQIFDFDSVNEAHDYMKSRKNKGKIVVQID